MKMVLQTPENMLPNPEEFGKCFHELFKQPTENQRFVENNQKYSGVVSLCFYRKRIEWKKLKKKGSKSKDKRKNKLELLNESGSLSPPEIELPGNASSFAIFASVRLAVLERWMRQATQEYLQSSCSVPVHDLSEMDSDTEDNSQSTTYLPLRVSKVIYLLISHYIS